MSETVKWVAFFAGALVMAGLYVAWFMSQWNAAVARARAARIGGCYVNVMPLLPGCQGGSHWPRDPVQLADGTTVAHICRRCDHDWADEHWVKTGAS